jgi:hypothetical protein
VSAILDPYLQRRAYTWLRRDAAEPIGNGRVIYDALFSRTGIQTYGDSIEYRPDSEVFAEPSRKSGGNGPAVLIHPSRNFGTKFDGTYPVKGCTGDNIVVHADGIHTAGKLIVWDDEWNGAIESEQITELSVGYTIVADRTPGVAPDGTRYDLVHREIVWDHVAGVPAGNAGTARVVTDALASMPLATRAALADMAAARMDARPMYFTLGRWPKRESPRMYTDVIPPDSKEYIKRDALAVVAPKLTALGPTPTAKQVLDVWIDVCGLSDDPAMLKVCAALGSMQAPGTAGAGAPVMDAAALEQQRIDAAEQADRRADVLELARHVFGRDYAHRSEVLDAERKPVLDAAGKPTTTPKTLDAIKREIISKIDATRLPRVDAYTDTVQRSVALDMQLAEVRAIVDARSSRAPVDALLAAVEQARGDNARGHKLEPTPEQVAVADQLAAQADPNRQPIFGRAPQPAATPAR